MHTPQVSAQDNPTTMIVYHPLRMDEFSGHGAGPFIPRGTRVPYVSRLPFPFLASPGLCVLPIHPSARSLAACHLHTPAFDNGMPPLHILCATLSGREHHKCANLKQIGSAPPPPGAPPPLGAGGKPLASRYIGFSKR